LGGKDDNETGKGGKKTKPFFPHGFLYPITEPSEKTGNRGCSKTRGILEQAQ
jgi:hypothetical protein